MNCQTEKEDGRKGSRFAYQSKCSYEINQMIKKKTKKKTNKQAPKQTNQPASSNKCTRCNYHCKKKEILKINILKC